jgi:rubrerythrin
VLDKRAVNNAKAARIAEAIKTGARRYALARAMWHPLGLGDTPHRYSCDHCGWTEVSRRPVTECPACKGFVGCYDVAPEGSLHVFKERRIDGKASM